MNKELRILVVEDVPADVELEMRELKRAGLRIAHRLVETEEAFRSALKEFRPEIIISDFSMPHFDGMLALALSRELVPDVPFIFVSGTIGEEYAIRALRNGATDYVLKNNLVRLPAAVERALEDTKERAARGRAEEALRESEEKYRMLWETTSEAVILMDRESRVQYANPAVMQVFGYAPEEVAGQEVAMLQPERLREAHRRGVRRYLETGVKTLNWGATELVALHRDGHEFPVEIAFSHMDFGGKTLFAGFMRDITERKNQELKIARLSRIHAVLSGINSAIVRIRDRQELFQEACRIAVEQAGFPLAWIGMLDGASQDLKAVAMAGIVLEYAKLLKPSVRDDIPAGQGTNGRAFRERKPIVDNDMAVDPNVGFMRGEALKHGIRAALSLPLLVEGVSVGVMGLYAKEKDYFDEEEMKLLTELAGDISFALEHIAGQEKIEKLSRVRAVSSGINAAIVRIREREGLLRETCRIASEEGRFEMIWIGTIDSEKQEVRPVAWTGFSAEAAHAVSWASVSAAKGTLSEAIQTRKPSVRNNIEAELPTGKLRKEAMQRGCFSTVCMPLEVEGRVAALIVLFATGREFFDEYELALLGEVASNISFALESIVRQEKIERLSRIRTVLGEMNTAIVRIRSKQQLFEEACRIAHEHGKFAMAWIGVLDESTQQISPVAKAGRDEGYLEALKLTIDPNATRNLAIAVEAIGRGAPVVCNDIATDGRMRPWRAAASQRGYRSMGMLPLLLEQRAVGVFALYSSETGFFDEDEMKLLVELAGDIAFALQTIEKQEKLDYLSYYDPLTGLPNRTLFNDRLEQRISAAQGDRKMFSVIMLDLERFRNINDSLGRQAGDNLLLQVGQRLKNALGETDILAHISGDHFAIATRRADEGGNVAHFIEKILTTAFGQPFEVGGNELRIASRAGVAVYPTDGTDAGSLLGNTEAALKNAKASGERYLFYQPKMNAAVAQTLLLENKLRQALEKEQFVLHYQPKVDLAQGTLIGLEALIRWNDPETGLVPPMRFIPLLEETGMILEVGRWAILKALEDYRVWHGRGHQPPRIAVNISLIQLRQKNFVDVVRDAIGVFPAGSHGLDLEITESLIMEDVAGSIEKLRALRDLGVNLAIDDFGTGYSSLGYLAKLPVNALKIDRSFIITMGKNADSMTIVSTIISLAHALNLKVIAEGVETEEQRNLLKLLKCDEMQGYLFSKPLPAVEIEAKFLGAAASA